MSKRKRKHYHGHELRQCPYCGLKMISRKKSYEYHRELCRKAFITTKMVGQDEERDK